MENNSTYNGDLTGSYLISEKIISEESKNLAKEAIERLSPSNNGIRATNDSIEVAIKVIKEVFSI